jgi:hypothetical protein
MGLIKEDNQIQSESENSDNEQVEPIKTKAKNAETYKTFTTDCGAEIVVKKTRGRKHSVTKPIVIYMEDLIEQDVIPQQKVIVKQKKGKGRPKKKLPVVQYVTKDEEVVNEDDGDVEQVIINKPKKEKLSAKDLKMIELQEKIVELEAVSGKKIRATRKGTVDKRSTKQPTEKQLAARKKFVEANKLRALEKKKKKEEDEKLKNKENVKQVVGELAEMKKQNQIQKEELQAQLQKEQEQAKPKPPPNPYANLV